MDTFMSVDTYICVHFRFVCISKIFVDILVITSGY